MKKILTLVFCLISMLSLVADPVSTLFESFETTSEFTLPTGWTSNIETDYDQGGVWVQDFSYDAYSGSNFVKLNGDTENNEDNLYLVTPELTDISANSLQFKAFGGLASGDLYISVGTMTDPNDASTYTETSLVPLTMDYGTYEVNFEATTDSYIAFYHHPIGDYAYSIYIDDVSWESSQVTPNPASVVFPAENESSVLLSLDDQTMQSNFKWTSNGGRPTTYKLYVGTDYPPTNVANGIDVSDVFEYHLEQALAYSEAYNWQIVPSNENGDASDCPVWSFITQNEIVVDFNTVDMYTEGFESGEVGYLPLGMTYDDTNSDGSFWSILANSENSQNAHTGDNAVHMMFSFSGPHDDWLWTPALNMIAGNTYEISFWYKAAAYGGVSEQMEVCIGDDANADAMTVQLYDNSAITNSSYQLATFEYTPQENGVKFLGFHAYTQDNFAQFVLLMDDLSIVQTSVANADADIEAPQVSLSNYPNPFNPQTTISYNIPQGIKGSISIYNVKGQLVKTFNNLDSNSNKVVWNGRNNDDKQIPSGIYLYKLTAGDNSTVSKMTLLK